MKVVITGAAGFLGWHTACRLRAVEGIEPIRLGRAEMADVRALEAAVAQADAVVHIAGVNRAPRDELVEQGNLDLAVQVGKVVRSAGRPVDIVFANSVQAGLDNAYGRGKAAAAAELAAAASAGGGHFADVRLPNLFGEHGRPRYNSFVATFVDDVSSGRTPSVTDDREIPLLHVQRAAHALIEAIGTDGSLVVPGDRRLISDVLATLQRCHALYRGRGEIPELTSRFDVDLFNTYRAATFPEMWPLRPQVHSDARGDLFESVRAHGGTGQSFVSTTRPGQVRGNHYHLHKIERFTVVRGEAEIRLRRLLHDEIVVFALSGNQPAFVDMPTLWVHSIRNIGQSELITTFWADQLLDPVSPDQYPEQVDH